MEKGFEVPIRILHDFVGRIERIKIPYMLSGSTAMIYYSVYRFTADIDIVMELRERDASRLIGVLEPDYYVPHDAVRRAIAANRMFNVVHMQTAYKVDCIIKKTSDFQGSAFDRRRRVNFDGSEIWIITLEDLIISKLLWAKDSKSDMQFKDVRNLLNIKKDETYFEKWIEKLDLKETLRLSKEATLDE
jgi:hypothetical protein